MALEEYQIYVRPYLTVDDIISIGEMMCACDNTITQECVLMLEVLDKCTDIPKEYITIQTDEDAEDKFMGFDLMKLSGLWQNVADEIINLDDVYEYVASKLNVGNAIAGFINESLEPLLDRMVSMLEKYEKKMPKAKEWKNILGDIPKVLDVVKEDGNADIIKGAIKMNTVGGDGE